MRQQSKKSKTKDKVTKEVEEVKQLPTISVKPITYSQKRFLYAISQNDITVCSGKAGSGRTHISVGIALQKLFHGEIKRIIITRPAVYEGKGQGFLPGDISSKMAPFLMPIYDELKEFISGDLLATMVGMSNYDESPQIEIVPLEFMRGRSLKHSYVLIDECQNCTYSQLRMLVTRIGKGSKLIFNGDITQCDLPDKTGFPTFMDKLKDVSGVGVVEMDDADIVRHPIIEKVITALGV